MRFQPPWEAGLKEVEEATEVQVAQVASLLILQQEVFNPHQTLILSSVEAVEVLNPHQTLEAEEAPNLPPTLILPSVALL